MKIDRIVCLTVDKRVKESTIRHDLEKWDMKVETFLCGEGELYPKDWYNFIDEKVEGRSQAWNYGRCLLKILSTSLEAGHEQILFLEDDAKINPRYENNFTEVFAYHLHQLSFVKNWDMCYLGGNIQCAGKVVQETPNVLRANYILDMQGMIFKRSAMEEIVKINPSTEATIDGMISEKVRNGVLTALTFSPVLITQYPNFSYNENKFVNRGLNHIL